MSSNQGVFPNILKVTSVIPIIKMVTSLIVTTTELFHPYLTLAKLKIYVNLSKKLSQENKYPILSIWLPKWILC